MRCANSKLVYGTESEMHKAVLSVMYCQNVMSLLIMCYLCMYKYEFLIVFQ